MNSSIMIRIYIYVCIFPVLFFQCAYFNTFYIAQESFEKAIQIIEKAPILDDNKIPSEAISLLDKAIVNSEIVIKKYPNSKYTNKAHLLMGIAFFYKNLYSYSITSLENINNNSSVDVQSQSDLWLSYSFLRSQNREGLDKHFSQINLNNLNKEDKYIYYNIKAELNELEGNLKDAYSNYILASDITKIKSRKVFIYRKLIKISSASEDFESNANYLYLLDQNIDDVNERKNIKIDWIKVKQKLGSYDDIILEIDQILNEPDYISIKPQLMIFKAKAYNKKGKIDLAKEVLNDIVSEYSKKNETSEAYFILGNLMLFEDFDVNKSKEYFEKSINEKSRSEFGKESKKSKKKIEQYNQILDDYAYFQNNSSIDTTFVEKKSSMNISLPNSKGEVLLDSLLFKIGQILYFDFNQQDSAINHYKYLLKEFPDTKYRRQLENIFKYHENPSSFSDLEYISFSNKKDILGYERDRGLDLSSNNSKINFYDSLYQSHQDSIALFNAAYIKDEFQYDIAGAIDIYRDIKVRFPKHPKIEFINERLSSIENNIKDIIKENDIKINFCLGFKLINDNDFDSAKTIFKSIKVSRKNPLYKTLNSLVKKIDSYSVLLEGYKSNLNNDSIIFKMAEIEYYYFNNKEESFSKLERIVDDFSESKFKEQSLWILINSSESYKESNKDTLNYELIDTLYARPYNPIDSWNQAQLSEENSKLEKISLKFESGENKND